MVNVVRLAGDEIFFREQSIFLRFFGIFWRQQVKGAVPVLWERENSLQTNFPGNALNNFGTEQYLLRLSRTEPTNFNDQVSRKGSFKEQSKNVVSPLDDRPTAERSRSHRPAVEP